MTGGIKIPVSADLSGVGQAVDQLGQKVKRTTGGDMGSKAAKQMAGGMSDAAANAAKLVRELEKAKRLQEALARNGKKVSTGDASELLKDYDYLRGTATPGLKRKLAGTSLESLLGTGYRSLGANESSSRRQRDSILMQLGIGGAGFNEESKQRRFAAYIVGAMRQGGGGLLGAVLPGGAGGTIARGAFTEAGSAGGLLAGGGRLLGGLGVAAAAMAAIKGISAVKGSMDSSEQESIGYSDLLRRMGSTPISYSSLRDTVRGTGGALGMDYASSAKLAQNYVRAAGIDGLSSVQLGRELTTAGGLGRQLGLDPEAGVGVMGALRHNKVSSGDEDNRRFAMMIGEAVARAGVFTKADEVLQAVEGYTKEATRAALSPANTSGYISALGNMLEGGPAGMDPSKAASILGTVDNSFRHNGGEAQRNFMLGALQRSLPGITSVDMGFMQDAGMFARAGDVFGEGSNAWNAADSGTRERYRKLVANGGNKTFFDMAMGQLGGMSSDEQRLNMTGLMGLSNSDAAALQAIVKQRGGLTQAMDGAASAYGLDPAKLSAGAQRNLLDVHYGNPDQLRRKAAWLRTQNLTDGEQSMLNAAEKEPGMGDQNLRATLAKLGVKYGNDETSGDVSRQNLAKMSNLASDVATKLIPLTNAIREAVVVVANKITLGSFKDKWGNSERAGAALDGQLDGVAFGERQGIIGAERARVNADPGAYTEEYKNRIEALFQGSGGAKALGDGGSAPTSIAGRATRSRRDQAALAKMIREPNYRYDDLFRRAASRYPGMDWRDLKQIAAQESGFREAITARNKDGSVDQGLMQLNDKYNRARGITAESALDPEVNVNTGASVWADALKRAKGDTRMAFAIYNGGTKPGSQALQYADNAMALRAEAMGTPMPGDAKRPQQLAQNQHQTHDVNVHLLGPGGKPMAAPARVQLGAPRAAGAR